MDRGGDGWWDRRKGEAIGEIDDEFLDRFASSFPLVHDCYVTSLENFSDVQRIFRVYNHIPHKGGPSTTILKFRIIHRA